MGKFWIVALETYKRNIKSVTFIVMILAPFLLVGLMGLVTYFASDANSASDIAIVTEDPQLRQAFEVGTSFKVEPAIETEEEATRALKDERLAGYLVLSNDTATGEVKGHLVSTTSLGTTAEGELTQIMTNYQLGQTASLLNLKAEDVQRLSRAAQLTSDVVAVEKDEIVDNKTNHAALSFASFIIAFAMYTIILMYAQVTASEVASEKGTRIMEIILSSTSAAKHFYGKVMGIFLVILTQVLTYLVIGIAAFFSVQDLPIVKEFLAAISLRELLAGFLGYNLIYLLFGVMIYTILAAFCGSLVSKAEDAGKAVAPVTYLTIFGFILNSMFGLSNPQHILIKVSSYIPFVSSFTMPSRIASGTVSDFGILVSLLILIAATGLILVAAAKLYGSTALVYSDEGIIKTFKRAVSIMRQNKKVS